MVVFMSKYYRIWDGKTKNAWMLPEAELNTLVGKESHFVSVCYYNEDQYKEFQKTKSVAGVVNVKTNQIWFDFDSPDLNKSKQDSSLLIDRLIKFGFPTDSIELFFSANKGFHVIAKVTNDLIPYQVKKIVEELGQGLDTLDRKIYDPARILRAPNTKHEKSGLYKVQIPVDQFTSTSIDQIKEYAKKTWTLINANPVTIPDEILSKQEPLQSKKEVIINVTDPLRIQEIDFKNKPQGFRDYKWSLVMGRFEIGQRNKSMMVIASTCRALKYGKSHTEAMCLAADKLHCEITGDSPINEYSLNNEVLDVVFSGHWNGGQYSVENDLDLRNYCEKHGFKTEKENFAEVIGLNQVSASFKHFVKNIDANTILTGIKRIDEALPITVGQNLGLVGSASSGKTAICLEILKHTSMNGVVSVMASLDMHRNRLYEKVLNKVSHEVYGHDVPRKELYE